MVLWIRKWVCWPLSYTASLGSEELENIAQSWFINTCLVISWRGVAKNLFLWNLFFWNLPCGHQKRKLFHTSFTCHLEKDWQKYKNKFKTWNKLDHFVTNDIFGFKEVRRHYTRFCNEKSLLVVFQLLSNGMQNFCWENWNIWHSWRGQRRQLWGQSNKNFTLKGKPWIMPELSKYLVNTVWHKPLRIFVSVSQPGFWETFVFLGEYLWAW